MRPHSGERTKRYTVFIVDDHPLFRIGLASLLKSDESLELCGEAEDAASALSQLRARPVDLVIIDISLRGANGIELLKQLKSEQPELRALLMSMHDEELYAERALRAGAVGYIRKDSPPDRVLDSIHRVLRGLIVLSEDSAEDMVGRLLSRKATPSGPAPQSLSDRELEILHLMAEGASTRECAERLHISVKTVEAHQASLKLKLGLKGVHQLRRYAVLWANPDAAQPPTAASTRTPGES